MNGKTFTIPLNRKNTPTMKKTLLLVSLLGTGIAVLAQDNPQNQNQTPSQTNQANQTNNAYGADGRIAARDMQGPGDPAALPLMHTYVPDDVMSRVKGTYGAKLYAVAGVKSGTGDDAYQLTLIENGQSRYEWIDATGSAVAHVFRTPETDSLLAAKRANNNTDANTGVNTTTGEPAPTTNSGVTDPNAVNVTNNANTQTTDPNAANNPNATNTLNNTAPANNTGNPNNPNNPNNTQPNTDAVPPAMGTDTNRKANTNPNDPNTGTGNVNNTNQQNTNQQRTDTKSNTTKPRENK